MEVLEPWRFTILLSKQRGVSLTFRKDSNKRNNSARNKNSVDDFKVTQLLSLKKAL
jgi:hypothetical protein